MSYTPEQLEEKFNQLPKDLQDIMVSIETADIVNSIGEEFDLHIDQIGKLADQTGLVMLGVMMPNEFVGALSVELGIERLLANKIANRVNERLFYKIRDSLKVAREKNKGPSATETITGIPDREELLAGIENPQTIPTPNRFTPRPPERPLQTEPTEVVAETIEPPEEEKDIFEMKTTESVGLPKTETNKGSGSDPYREKI